MLSNRTGAGYYALCTVGVPTVTDADAARKIQEVVGALTGLKHYTRTGDNRALCGVFVGGGLRGVERRSVGELAWHLNDRDRDTWPTQLCHLCCEEIVNLAFSEDFALWGVWLGQP